MAAVSADEQKIQADQDAPQQRRVFLVTGGSGMVGRAVQTVVQRQPQPEDGVPEEWVFLGSKDGDLRNLQEAEAIFEKYRPTHVLHLAAFVGGLFRNLNYPVEFWTSNVRMNDNVMQLSHRFGVQKLVSCLSTCIFPDKTSYPIDESMIHNGPPHESNEPYAYAKRMIDVLNRAYHRQYKCNFTSVVPTNIYGEWDNFHLQDSHVVPGLIHKFYLAQQNGTPVTVFGSGKPLRQFIYSQDLAELMLWTLREYESPEPIILSVDEDQEVTIRDVVESIAKAMKFEGEIIWDSSKSDGQYKKTASNAKLRKLRPDFKFVSFQEGIEKTVQWFLEHYDEIRK